MKCIVSQSNWVSNATNSNAIISKSKTIFWILFCISEIYIKFRILWKQRWASKVIFFLIYRLQKAGLLTCRKSPVSEHLRKGNILKGRKHCLNQHDSIFVIFFDHSERKAAPKIWFQQYVKSRNCLLTYWHPMASILSQEKQVLNGTNSNAIISKSENISLIFFWISENYIKFGILWKKRSASKVIFSKIIDFKKRSYLYAQKIPCQNTYLQSTC